MPTGSDAAPVYEYWWTLGFHRASAPDTRFRRWRARTHDQGEAQHDKSETFGEPAAHVGIFFPTDVNWRVQEITATLKFLTPLKDQHPIWQDISDNLTKLSPLLTDAASVAGLVPGGGTASRVLATVAKLQVASVPQTTIPWSVEKTACQSASGGLLEGIEWVLPKNTFDLLGGRVSGSVAVTFMQAQPGDKTETTPGSGDVMARALVWRDDHAHRIPELEPENDSQHEPNEDYLSLSVTPSLPPKT